MATAHLPIQKSKYYEHNGEPGCQGPDEVNSKFRNFWDPTSYWICERQGSRAHLKQCQSWQLYSEERGRCVHYTEWSWTEPREPPSRPRS